MPEGGLWQIIVLYLRVVIGYWWALLPGLVLPLIDVAQFHRAEEKKIKIPPRVRSTVMLAANKRVSVEITSNVPLQQPTFGVTCNGECSCTPATVDDVPTGSASFPTTQKSVCAFQVKDPEMVKAGTPIRLWVLSKNEPQVTAITRAEGAKKAN